jgi:hypothetical protein
MNAGRVSVNFAKRMQPAWKLSRLNKKEKRQASEPACRYPYSPKTLKHRLSSGGVGSSSGRQATNLSER